MNKQASRSKPRRQPVRKEVKPGPPASDKDAAALIEPSEPIALKPDGYYWQTENGRREFGPFESYELAAADMHVGEENLGTTNNLTEVEDEIGVASWIDADTGTLAEGQSPPHLEGE
ncbi:hypothetical protein [Roseateles oligotrophus]|uniref:Uncharacterized protein n=1 Tax=Roseateles oligotrophus TaxID=1769250 RepID=A0ABT2YMK4_9BURK|nr:hypothetical protein [Roseateles oligotrophus]MCV2371300.1 hypothetical protein [Roseateles oligotrophus]